MFKKHLMIIFYYVLLIDFVLYHLRLKKQKFVWVINIIKKISVIFHNIFLIRIYYGHPITFCMINITDVNLTILIFTFLIKNSKLINL